ncbi:MAG: hypothetical protein ACM3ZQ_00625 [Bacillota bacterium]
MRITHYDLNVKLIYPVPAYSELQPGQLQVNSTMTIERELGDDTVPISLLLYRLMNVTSVKIGGVSVPFTAAVEAFPDLPNMHVKQIVISPQAIGIAKVITMSVTYHGTMSGYREVWQYVWDSVTPSYTLLRPDALWYPVLATASAASWFKSFQQSFTTSLTVECPQHCLVAAAGTPSQEVITDDRRVCHWTCMEPHTRIDLACADFSILENSGVRIYHLPDTDQWAAKAGEWVQFTLATMSRWLGPRARKGFALVQIPRGWGSQASAEIVLQELSDSAGAIENPTQYRVVAHELCHFWTPRSSDHPNRFTDETIATYYETRLVGARFGPDEYKRRLESLRQAYLRTPGAQTVSLANAGRSSDIHVLTRCKGPLAMHVLAGHLGIERMDHLIGEFVANYPTAASLADFVGLLTQRHGTEPWLPSFLAEWMTGLECNAILHSDERFSELFSRPSHYLSQ